MKRTLLEAVKVIPYTSGEVIDRDGCLSAILGAKVSVAGKLSVEVSHCDTEGGAFTAVDDSMIGLGKPLTDVSVTTDTNINFDLDLLGCKRYLKLTVTAEDGAAAAYALVLGDSETQPV